MFLNIDDLVLAMFTQDKKWYRARVLKVTEAASSPVVEVLYIDYGNTESVPMTKYADVYALTITVLM